MREYLSIFSLVGLTVGIIVFTFVFLSAVGMPYETYRAWLTVLLSFTSLISNAAISYYFAHKMKPGARHRQGQSQDISDLRRTKEDSD
jgi:hypothetical protein